MNEYLSILMASLKHMRSEEKQEIVADYKEHFEIGLEAGKTEEDIAAELGDPRQLAKMYSAHNAVEKAHASKGFGDAVKMLGAVLSFKIGGGIVIGTLYLICAAVLVSVFAAAAVLIIGSAGTLVLAVMNLVKPFIAYALMAAFTAMALGCGGALAWKGNKKLWQAVFGRLPGLARRMTNEKRHG
ncbi:MAG: DUF1700 domain-containing protein [Eubacteriales bacterium]|nr:DUF1700 domain-containing protein [Eubacteriales bacterium]